MLKTSRRRGSMVALTMRRTMVLVVMSSALAVCAGLSVSFAFGAPPVINASSIGTDGSSVPLPTPPGDEDFNWSANGLYHLRTVPSASGVVVVDTATNTTAPAIIPQRPASRVANNGTVAYGTVGGTNTLYVVPFGAGEPIPVFTASGATPYLGDLRLSGDGRNVVFLTNSGGFPGLVELHSYDVNERSTVTLSSWEYPGTAGALFPNTLDWIDATAEHALASYCGSTNTESCIWAGEGRMTLASPLAPVLLEPPGSMPEYDAYTTLDDVSENGQTAIFDAGPDIYTDYKNVQYLFTPEAGYRTVPVIDGEECFARRQGNDGEGPLLLQAALSENGRYLACEVETGDNLHSNDDVAIYLVDLQTSTATLIDPSTPRDDYSPQWVANDGTRFIYQAETQNREAHSERETFEWTRSPEPKPETPSSSNGGGGSSPSPPTTPPLSPSPSHCLSYIVIDSRGSGERFGTSPPGEAFTEAFRKHHQGVGVIDNPYPAVSILGSVDSIINLIGAGLGIGPLGAYHDSVVDGEKWLRHEIPAEIASCPSAKLLLTGYSQGAQVTADVYQRSVSSVERKHILAVVLFGDPYFNPTDSRADWGNYNHYKSGILGWRRSFKGDRRVVSDCHAHDPVCQHPTLSEVLRYGFSEHKKYPVDAAALARRF
jgi:hypothetical protein